MLSGQYFVFYRHCAATAYTATALPPLPPPRSCKAATTATKLAIASKMLPPRFRRLRRLRFHCHHRRCYRCRFHVTAAPAAVLPLPLPACHCHRCAASTVAVLLPSPPCCHRLRRHAAATATTTAPGLTLPPPPRFRLRCCAVTMLTHHNYLIVA